MNIAYPQTAFDTDIAAIDGFAALLCGGFENPEGISGLVRLTVPEYPEQGFFVRFSDELHVERHNLDRAADTEVIIPIATIHRIFAEFETLDWRNPSIIGTITFSGNLDLANHLSKACIRPSNWTRYQPCHSKPWPYRPCGQPAPLRPCRDCSDRDRARRPQALLFLRCPPDGLARCPLSQGDERGSLV